MSKKNKPSQPIDDPAIMRRIIDVSQDAFAILNADLTLRYADPEASRLLDTDPGSLAGQKITDAFMPLIGADEALEAIVRGQDEQFSIEMVNYPGTDKGLRYANVIVVPVDPEQPSAGLLMILQDQSSYGRLHQELTQQRNELALVTGELSRYANELEAQNAALEVFSQIVAHDLRSPLHLIQGYLELMQINNDLPADKRLDYIKRTRHALERMGSIIDSLLMLARLRKDSIEIKPVMLSRVIADAIENTAYQAEMAKVPITVEEPLPSVRAHHDLMVSVITNLIDNAIKYRDTLNKAPQITIRAQTTGEAVRIEVSDNGIGIAKGSHDSLFEMFQRAHAGAVPGFGIGLSIVHQSIRKMGGEVGVESEPGKGSTFWVRLPAASE